MTQKFTHKGYTLLQTDYNYHYMIFSDDGHMVMHVPYDKPLIEEKAREFIEHYITLAGIPIINLSDLNLTNTITNCQKNALTGNWHR